ncbi:MAG: hypothetical protein R3345_02925, partial [Fulvivirga sp.]|nr:hypothetical protein [Fulvivirga sp.]
MKQGFVKADQVVLEILHSLGQTTLHKYVYILHYLIVGYRKHIMTTIPITKQVCLPVNKAKMISFPTDFIGLESVFLRNGDRKTRFYPDGTIVRQDEDDKAYFPNEVKDQRTTYDEIHNRDAASFKGLSRPNEGFYNVNLNKKRIEFAVDANIKAGQKVWIEYISNDENPDT